MMSRQFSGFLEPIHSIVAVHQEFGTLTLNASSGSKVDEDLTIADVQAGVPRRSFTSETLRNPKPMHHGIRGLL